MSKIKEFYHEEICKGMQDEMETEYDNQFVEFMANKSRSEIIAAFENEAENAQILARAEEMTHSEMPNFFR